MANHTAIGIFDSGIGGLSVLRHIHQSLPYENLLYFADSGYAPYGDKPEQAVLARSLGITEFLLQQGAKAIVVACNTATAAAINTIRTTYPHLPIVGIEPGLKPAASRTQTKVVGVLATQTTLASNRVLSLQKQLTDTTGVRFILQPCIGLADHIEKGELHSAAITLLIRRYIVPLIAQNIDTLVLGCTHYPFVRPTIEAIIQHITNKSITIIDTGDAVTQQLVRVLDAHNLQQKATQIGSLTAFTTGSHTALKTIFSNLLALKPRVIQIDAITEPTK